MKPSHVKMYDACAFVRLFMLNGFNVMIITTIVLKERPNQSNINIWNGELFNFMACNVTIHK
jgi:hypothetical protein